MDEDHNAAITVFDSMQVYDSMFTILELYI